MKISLRVGNGATLSCCYLIGGFDGSRVALISDPGSLEILHRRVQTECYLMNGASILYNMTNDDDKEI